MTTEELMSRADPASGPVPQAGRGELLATFLEDDPRADRVEADPTTGPGRIGRRRVLVLAGTAGALATGAAAWAVLDTGGPGGATPAAAVVLGRAAAAAAAGMATPAVDVAEYLYVRTDAVYGTTTQLADESVLSWLDHQLLEVWVPGDPSRPWVQRTGPRTPYRFFHPGDEARARAAGALSPAGAAEIQRAVGGEFAGPGPASWQTPTPGFLAGLPRDPGRLLARIRRDSAGQGSSPDGEAFVTIGDVLRYPAVPADLRAALFRTAQHIPGVTLTAGQATLAGRTGTAVGRDEGGDSRYEIVFDPDTARLIGERDTVLRANSGFPAGAVTTLTSVTVDVVSTAP